MKCANCNRNSDEQVLCKGCAGHLQRSLAELPVQVAEAHKYLAPTKGGHGTNTGEPVIGINVTALDWITGKPITDMADVSEAVASRKVGEQITVTVLRDGKSQTLTLTLKDRPADIGVKK